MSENTESLINRFVKEIEWIRESLVVMDDLAQPVMGIRDWDDAICTEFGGKKLVVSVDGPYAKRLVLKSALVHAATDVVVKGAKALFALDTVIGVESDIREMLESLKNQALAMAIPILGGNTKIEDTAPMANIVVVGKLLLDEPIRDNAAESGDVIALFGEPLWGEQNERLELAKKMFDCWFGILGAEIKIHAAKDVTKGGLSTTAYEMEKKSERKFKLDEQIPYSTTRNLDNFIITAAKNEIGEIKKHCSKAGVRLEEIGVVE